MRLPPTLSGLMLLSKQKNQQRYDQQMSSGEKGKALNEMCAG